MCHYFISSSLSFSSFLPPPSSACYHSTTPNIFTADIRNLIQPGCRWTVELSMHRAHFISSLGFSPHTPLPQSDRSIHHSRELADATHSTVRLPRTGTGGGIDLCLSSHINMSDKCVTNCAVPPSVYSHHVFSVPGTDTWTKRFSAGIYGCYCR